MQFSSQQHAVRGDGMAFFFVRKLFGFSSNGGISKQLIRNISKSINGVSTFSVSVTSDIFKDDSVSQGKKVTFNFE